MTINAIVESVPGTVNNRYFVEITDGGITLVRAEASTHCERNKEMESAARNAISRLRHLADDAEKTLRAMGILRDGGPKK